MAEAEETSVPIQLIPSINLPPPKLLVMDENLAKNWRQWKKIWRQYVIATGTYKQDDLVRVSRLLSVIGEDAAKTFDTFTWSDGEKEDSIKDVLAKFDEYCEPLSKLYLPLI